MRAKNADKKVIQPLETGVLGFDQVLKKIANADPEKVREMEAAKTAFVEGTVKITSPPPRFKY